MAYASDVRASGLTLSQRIAGIRAAIADRLAKRAVYLTTLRELAQLTDRDLADLGIHRSAIKGIAADAAYGRK